MSSQYNESDTELAIETYRRVLEIEPNFVDAYANLASALTEKNELVAAEGCFHKLLQICPQRAYQAKIISNLAGLKRRLGQLEQAKSFYLKLLELEDLPDCHEAAHLNLGFVLRQEERSPEAILHFSEAVRIRPTNGETYISMGLAFREMLDFSSAIMCFQKAIAINPASASAHCYLATTYKDNLSIPEAIVNYQTALKIQPDYPDAYCNLAYCLQFVCDWTNYDERMSKVAEMVQFQLDNKQQPSVLPHHAMLFPLSHEQRKQIAVHYAETCIKRVSSIYSLRKFVHSFPHKLNKGTRLKIGYISSDFGNHPTSHLMQSIPRFHKRDLFEIYCYALNPDDSTTFRQKVASTSENFVDLSKIPCNRDAAARIFEDGIHILVNLNGHTRGARNEIFALRPAPIQVMWLGYPGTTGASYMDYFITDPVTTPLEFANHFTEKLAYMPRTYFVGDHKHMFPHLKERVAVSDQKSMEEPENVLDNVVVMNAWKDSANTLMQHVQMKEISQIIRVKSRESNVYEHVTFSFKVAELTTTTPIENMISSGHKGTTVNGIVLQNGLAASQMNPKVGSGEEVPQNILITTRQQYGLPTDAIVYCNFNQLYKIDPLTLISWINILKRVQNSILWLLRFPAAGRTNILNFVTAHGLDPERIIFTTVASKEEHVRRSQLVDVCLDTPLCNGHTTSMDILWAGTPVVTMPMETLASRVTASQLMTLGCPELIATSREDYENIAVTLGLNILHRKAIRAKVWRARKESVLFEVEAYTRDLERLYQKMWKQWETGNEPIHIIN